MIIKNNLYLVSCDNPRIKAFIKKKKHVVMKIKQPWKKGKIFEKPKIKSPQLFRRVSKIKKIVLKKRAKEEKTMNNNTK